MTYLARWPDYFHVAEGPGNRIMGYSKKLFTLSASFTLKGLFFFWAEFKRAHLVHCIVLYYIVSSCVDLYNLCLVTVVYNIFYQTTDDIVSVPE